MPPRGYRKPARVLRSKQFTFWVTPTEKDQIREAARLARVTPSAYVRSAALGSRQRAQPGADADELVRQLSRVGNNLNQLRVIAERKARPAVELLDASREQVRALLRKKAGKPVPAKALSELIHEGATVNTLAYRANTGRFPSIGALRNALDGLTEALGAFAS